MNVRPSSAIFQPLSDSNTDNLSNYPRRQVKDLIMVRDSLKD